MASTCVLGQDVQCTVLRVVWRWEEQENEDGDYFVILEDDVVFDLVTTLHRARRSTCLLSILLEPHSALSGDAAIDDQHLPWLRFPCPQQRGKDLTDQVHVVGGGVRIHPENARMSGRHGLQYVAQCVACAALTPLVWQ